MNTAREFTERLQDLLRHEHGALAEFIVLLADFDRRRMWAELGHASLFVFLHRDLRLSKGAAFYRATAAGLARRIPEVVEALRQAKLCLSTVVEVAKVITPENVDDVLPRFFGLSRREAQEVVAELQPRIAPPLRDVVTVPRPAESAPALQLSCPADADLGQGLASQPADASAVETRPPASVAPAMSAAPAHRASSDTLEPLSAELTRIHVTLPRRVLKKLDVARAALSHSHPGAGLAEIIEAAVDLLLDRHAKRNGLVKKPRKTPAPSTDSDRVPAHVRRAVFERDGGRCQHPIASGGVCGSTLRVELHHLESRHRGGLHTVENLTTRCGFHHDRETRKEFGDEVVDGIVRRKRARRDGSDGPPLREP